ncbi:MAG: hypothetical protein ABS35_25695 [Kaistia sp. SCN 65-12]|nr:MAG: hypothetical protein ABS35_25695 [Kaistia sp. SCN 65-12]
MTRADARYEVLQILAEARARNLPAPMVSIAIAHFLRKNGFELPPSIIAWLEEGADEPIVLH